MTSRSSLAQDSIRKKPSQRKPQPVALYPCITYKMLTLRLEYVSSVQCPRRWPERMMAFDRDCHQGMRARPRNAVLGKGVLGA